MEPTYPPQPDAQQQPFPSPEHRPAAQYQQQSPYGAQQAPGYTQAPQHPPAAGYQPYGAPAPQYGGPGGYQQAQQVEKPIGWFVVTWLFFWPLAIYSLTSAWGKIDEARYAGDIAGAQHHAARVRKLGKIALLVGIALNVITTAFVVIAIVNSDPYCSSYIDSYGNYRSGC